MVSQSVSESINQSINQSIALRQKSPQYVKLFGKRPHRRYTPDIVTASFRAIWIWSQFADRQV